MSQDKKEQDNKLIELRVEFREIVQRILEHMTNLGHYPRISNAYRSAKDQEKKQKQGYSMSAKPGTHTWGLACDIIDKRYGWNVCDESADFFSDLGDEVIKQGCVWGGSWFGKGGTRDNPMHKSPWNKYGIGWDPAHVEYKNPPKEWMTEYKGVEDVDKTNSKA